jgi:hypothetical protein
MCRFASRSLVISKPAQFPKPEPPALGGSNIIHLFTHLDMRTPILVLKASYLVFEATNVPQ